MAEYIKKDELLKFKADVYDEDGHVLYAVPTGCIVAMPPADVAPVRHGRWERTADGAALCTACKRKMNPSQYGYAFCSLCGAKMDGGTN